MRLAERRGLTLCDAAYPELASSRSLPLATLVPQLRAAAERISLLSPIAWDTTYRIQKGLSVSDAVRAFLMRVAAEQQLPFELRVPNLVTRDAMAEAETILSKRRARFDPRRPVRHESAEAARLIPQR